jgi:hypothetical protein
VIGGWLAGDWQSGIEILVISDIDGFSAVYRRQDSCHAKKQIDCADPALGLSPSLHLGFDRRQSSDYGEGWTVDEDEASLGLAQAIDFVQAIEAYLKNRRVGFPYLSG